MESPNIIQQRKRVSKTGFKSSETSVGDQCYEINDSDDLKNTLSDEYQQGSLGADLELKSGISVNIPGLGNTSVLLIVLVGRLINALTTITYFSPDEYWQSWEVAHRMVYNYGYLTWEWTHKIRSVCYPGLIASVFYALKNTGLDSYPLLIMSPKILHAIIASAGDYFTVKLAIRLYGKGITRWITFCALTSWFHLFISTRALPSSPEMALTIAALFYWPFAELTVVNRWSLEISLLLASLACVLRPTAAVIWMYLGIQLLLHPNQAVSRVRILVSTSFIMGLALGSMVFVDTLFFGERVLVPWRFFQFNVAQKISAFYGVSSWYFYPLLGLPTLLTTFLPFVYLGFKRSQASKKLLGLSGFVICIYSLLPHKELRFIYPILPGLLVVAARGLQQFKPTRSHLCFLAFSQISVALYFNRWHQSGVVQVMHTLHYDESVKSVGFLMPCHSTPYHAFIHRPVPMWFITCHPPLE
ncbi:glycosylphosphatidylinositol anchor biosynthesis, variant 5 [Entomophthora muscae]|nr:glycosylphosphatidylinositol anchor biosynthesis, variant 5 [Entomophthora muscae]